MPDEVTNASDLGVGASIALYIGNNTVRAGMDGTETLTGVDDLTITASGDHDDETRAEAGAAGTNTTIGGAIAIAVVDNLAEVDLGNAGSTLTVGGSLTGEASNAGTSETVADATVSGGMTAIGAAVALAFVDNRSTANVRRQLSVAGAASMTARNAGGSSVEAKSSVAGTEEEMGDPDAMGGGADGQQDEAISFADSRGGAMDTGVASEADADSRAAVPAASASRRRWR
ncbi:MAG: hypothetical protein H6844_06265 [Alphaproteobacteria bacterium]|nr:hypothetical protein [Alphaproteobacteria bacterium]